MFLCFWWQIIYIYWLTRCSKKHIWMYFYSTNIYSNLFIWWFHFLHLVLIYTLNYIDIQYQFIPSNILYFNSKYFSISLTVLIVTLMSCTVLIVTLMSCNLYINLSPLERGIYGPVNNHSSIEMIAILFFFYFIGLELLAYKFHITT